ncbi:MAG: GNAT family N-acetyltransferase [Candidatus Nanopelagicales bacterium]
MRAALPDVMHGPRLDLVLVTVEQLLSRAPDHDGPAVPLGYADPGDVLAYDDSPLRWRIPQVREDPTANPWLIRLAVERATGTIVGLANFHAPPDARGMVEIGYRVVEAYRRQGYGREIATTMWRAAAAHPDVRVLRASVSPTNDASLAIVRAAGFVQVGEEWDDEDGLELVLEVAAPDVVLD